MTWLRSIVPLLLVAPSLARADDVPDLPLPRWRAPALTTTRAQLVSVPPEMTQAQRLRQAGLWVSSAGWAAVLAGGISSAVAVGMNTSDTVVIDYRDDGRPLYDTRPSAALVDQRDRLFTTSTALFVVGATLAAGGFVAFTIGQARITRWHHERPHDPLPPLSGAE